MLLVNENSRAKRKSTYDDGGKKNNTKFYGCCGKFTRLNTCSKKNNYASCLTDCELYGKTINKLRRWKAGKTIIIK